MRKNPIQEEIASLIKSGVDFGLTDEEKVILEMRWGLSTGTLMKISEVAQSTGKSKNLVFQLERSALEKLRTHADKRSC